MDTAEPAHRYSRRPACRCHSPICVQFSESFAPCAALRPIVNSIVYCSPERAHVPRIGLPTSRQSSIEQFGSTWSHFREECVHMKNQLGIIVGLSALMIGP